MTGSIDVSTHGRVVQVTITKSRAFLWLTADRRRDMLSALSRFDDADVILLVFRDLDGRPVQDAGPDLPDAGDATAPTLADLCAAVAAAPVPVVALLEGAVDGGAAEIALAASARLATSTARMCFAAARVGRITGNGSTQRLPALIGAEQALAILTSGLPVPAPEALAMGLVDQVIESETPAEAVEQARIRAPQVARRADQRPGLLNGRTYLQAVAAARKDAAPDSLAEALVNCVESALLLPADQGLAFESAMALQRATHPEAAALTHLYRAEQVALQVPAPLRAVKVASIAAPALAGASLALAGVVLMALARGLGVTVHETDRSRLVPMLNAIASRQEAAVQAGNLTPEQRDADWARLRPVADAAALAEADLVIVAPDTPLPQTRASVPMLVMGRSELRAGAFRLVLSGRVAELGLPSSCPAQPAAQALGFLRRLGLTVVLTGTQSPLGISGRLAGAGGAALRGLLSLGVRPEAIQSALTGFGLTAPALPASDGSLTDREMPADEILQRWLAALANEGARLLASGLALRASDIDLVAVRGLGFPQSHGGPMHLADDRGLLIIRRDLLRWADEGEVWKPVPALDALVSVGRGFASVSPE